MFLVRAGDVNPTNLGTVLMKPSQSEPLTMSVKVALEAGDRIVLGALSKGFEYFALEGVTVRIGRFVTSF